MLTKAQLVEIYPKCPRDKIDKYAVELWAAMQQGQIVTLPRAAAFLGQIAVESGELQYMREIWDPVKVPNQARYERNFVAAWPPTAQDERNRLAHRLGNSDKGDGFKFRGWGPIQNTGRSNTFKASMALFGDERLISRSELLDDSSVGFLGAKWYWMDRGLNAQADLLNYKEITRLINGGYTHHDLRVDYFIRALTVLGLPALSNILV